MAEEYDKREMMPFDYCDDIERFISVLNRVRQRITFYPPKHPALPSFLDECYQAFTALVRDRSNVMFEFVKGSLIIDHRYKIPGSPILEAFSFEMYRRGFASIQLSDSCSQDTLVAFVKSIAVKSEDVVEQGGILEYIRKQGLIEHGELEGISIKEIDYEKLFEAETEGPPEGREQISDPDVAQRAERILDMVFNNEAGPIRESASSFGRILDEPDMLVKLFREKSSQLSQSVKDTSEPVEGVVRQPKIYSFFQLLVSYESQLPTEIARSLSKKTASLFNRLSHDERLELLDEILRNTTVSDVDFSGLFAALTENDIADIVYPLVKEGTEDDLARLQRMIPLLAANAEKRNLVVFITNYKFKSEGYFDIEGTEKWQRFTQAVHGAEGLTDASTTQTTAEDPTHKPAPADLLKQFTDSEIEAHYLDSLIELLYQTHNLNELISLIDELKKILNDALESQQCHVIEKVVVGIQEAINSDQIEDQHVLNYLSEQYAMINEQHLLDGLVICLRERDAEGSQLLQDILGKCEFDVATTVFERLIGEQDRVVRKKLIGLLAESKQIGRKAIQTLRQNLRSNVWYVTRNALTVLKEIGSEDDIPYIEKLLDHKDGRIRREVISALGRIGGASAMKRLLRLVESPDHPTNLRIMALEYIAPDAGDSIVSVLKKLIHKSCLLSENAELKINAIEKLGQVDSPEAIRALIEILKQTPLLHRSDWKKYKQTAALILKSKNVDRAEHLIAKYT